MGHERAPRLLVAPRVRPARPGLGRRGRRTHAHRRGRRLQQPAAAGRLQHRRDQQPGRRRAQRRPAAAHPRLLQPADGPPVHRARRADHSRHQRHLLLEGQHASRAALRRQPCAQHAVQGDHRPDRQDRDRQATLERADHHLRHPAAAHAGAGAHPPPDPVEPPVGALRRGPCRRDGAVGAVVVRLLVGVLHRRQGRAEGGGGQWRHTRRDRDRQRLVARRLADGRPPCLHPRRQDLRPDVRDREDRRVRSRAGPDAGRLGQGQVHLGGRRRPVHTGRGRVYPAARGAAGDGDPGRRLDRTRRRPRRLPAGQ